MPKKEKTISSEQAGAVVDEALTRLERAVLSRKKDGQTNNGEQSAYVEQLETENKQLTRDFAEMKKNCIALKNGYEILEEKCKKLEQANDSAEKELVLSLHDLDQLIAQKSLH